MRDPKNVFHLAIPTHDLESAEAFYVRGLGCRLARVYDDRLTLDFYGDQVVCHLDPDKIDPAPEMYPRHFGITFRDEEDFRALHRRAEEHGLEFFAPLTTRFEGRREEHLTFFLKDPSNNLLEFKYYRDPEMMY